MAYGRTPWSQHHGGSVGAGLGGRLRSSKGEFLKVGRQGDANRLKELTSDAGGRGAQQEALAILLKLDFLQPVIEPVKARVFGDPRLVDGEVLGRDGLEIAA